MAALAGFPHRDEVEVRWRSFELDPQAPREYGQPLAEHLAAKYGMTIEQALGTQERVTALAAVEGLRFRFDRARPGNTFDAHRLLHHAVETLGPAAQDRLKERLFAAYLTDGVPIGDPEALVRVAATAGIDPGEARDVVESDRYADDVHHDEEQARRYGISGVPFFVVDSTYGVSGAQSADALREVLDVAWAEAHPQRLVTPAGRDGDDIGDGACADGSCPI